NADELKEDIKLKEGKKVCNKERKDNGKNNKVEDERNIIENMIESKGIEVENEKNIIKGNMIEKNNESVEVEQGTNKMEEQIEEAEMVEDSGEE
ncbi:17735_t:CDS:1, partial [Cetraspora pellucida]